MKLCFSLPTVDSITLGVAVGISIASTVVVIFIVEILVGFFLCHCINMHQSQSSNQKSSSNQQQQTGPEYEVPATSGKEKIKLRENIAYEHVHH